MQTQQDHWTQAQLLAGMRANEEEYEFPEQNITARRFPAERLTPEQTAEILELLQLAFNGGPAWYTLPVPREEHWRWRYFDRPGPARVDIMERDGRILGLSMSAWAYWLVQGQPRRGAAGGDLAYHPTIQGLGLNRLRSDWREAHFDVAHESEFNLGMGAHPASAKIRNSLGAKRAGNQPEMWEMVFNAQRALNPRRSTGVSGPTASNSMRSNTTVSVQAGAKRLPRPMLARYLKLQGRRVLARARAWRYRPMRNVPWTIRTIDRFTPDMDEMLREGMSQFDLVLLRDHEYLNWRFCDERGGPFTVRVAEEDGRVLGYAVTRAMSDRGLLADLLALPGRTDVAQSLVEDSIRLARAAGAPSLRCQMMQHHPYHSIFPKIGFITRLQLAHVNLRRRPGQIDLSFLESPTAAVHLMLGDTDVV